MWNVIISESINVRYCKVLSKFRQFPQFKFTMVRTWLFHLQKVLKIIPRKNRANERKNERDTIQRHQHRRCHFNWHRTLIYVLLSVRNENWEFLAVFFCELNPNKALTTANKTTKSNCKLVFVVFDQLFSKWMKIWHSI